MFREQDEILADTARAFIKNVDNALANSLITGRLAGQDEIFEELDVLSIAYGVGKTKRTYASVLRY